MSVNTPAYANQYFRSLLGMITFDPLPRGALSSWFDFKWTDKLPTMGSAARLGIEDRVFINILGFVFVLMLIFLLTRIIMLILPFLFDKVPGTETLYNVLSIKGSSRPLLIRFFIVLYMDLMVGGIVNTDNNYLLAVPSNWGPGGYLPFGDQLSVLVGYFFYFTALALPFIIVYLCQLKSRAPFMEKSKEVQFDAKYDVLYHEFRTSNSGPYHYYFVYVMRRFFFVMLCFWFSEP